MSPDQPPEQPPHRHRDPSVSPHDEGDEEGAAPPSEGPGEDRAVAEAAGLRRRPARSVVIAAALIAVAVAALFAYRSHQRRKALDEGLPKAAALLRLDTAAGYRAAADLLLPLAGLDPLEAGSMRAFAMSMLAADYRDPDGRLVAEGLLVEPTRADQVPAFADLATAALYLGRRAVGDAATYASRAGATAWSGHLKGRIAFLAGNLEVAAEPVASAIAADPKLAGAQALQGDLARRLRQDHAAARTAYQAALAASPLHPRAAFGLGKLALSGKIPLGEAREPLQRLLSDVPATPAPERARAALYLAALDQRAGDRAAARADLDAVKDPGSRAWADLAAATLAVERGSYHAVTGAPSIYQSTSDDDPPDLAPAPPAPPPAAAPLHPGPKPSAVPAKKALKKATVALPAKKGAAPAKKAASTLRKHPRRAR